MHSTLKITSNYNFIFVRLIFSKFSLKKTCVLFNNLLFLTLLTLYKIYVVWYIRGEKFSLEIACEVFEYYSQYTMVSCHANCTILKSFCLFLSPRFRFLRGKVHDLHVLMFLFFFFLIWSIFEFKIVEVLICEGILTRNLFDLHLYFDSVITKFSWFFLFKLIPYLVDQV